jgi:hypothetical protein
MASEIMSIAEERERQRREEREKGVRGIERDERERGDRSASWRFGAHRRSTAVPRHGLTLTGGSNVLYPAAASRQAFE